MTPEERCAVIESAVGPRLRALLLEAVKLCETRKPFPERAERFIDIAEGLGRAITPHTPCASGTCSHCCHMATAVSGYEAAMIGRYTGRVPVAQNRHGRIDPQAEQQQLLERFTAVACTFLVEGRCSIYPVRPMACRVHHSVNDTADNCRIVPGTPDGEAPRVPRVNLTAFITMQALAFLEDDYGDIREFFP